VNVSVNVSMSVRHGLPSGLPVVDADVESVRVQFCQQGGANFGHQPPNCRLLVVAQVNNAGDVPFGNSQHVAVCDGKGVGNRDGGGIFGPNAVGVQVAERTRAGVWVVIVPKI
jgi:hypothetical protein